MSKTLTSNYIPKIDAPRSVEIFNTLLNYHPACLPPSRSRGRENRGQRGRSLYFHHDGLPLAAHFPRGFDLRCLPLSCVCTFALIVGACYHASPLCVAVSTHAQGSGADGTCRTSLANALRAVRDRLPASTFSNRPFSQRSSRRLRPASAPAGKGDLVPTPDPNAFVSRISNRVCFY
jgi:hypothetical protein